MQHQQYISHSPPPPPIPPRDPQVHHHPYRKPSIQHQHRPLGKTWSLQSTDDFHNLSQDSGISPSPAQISQWSSINNNSLGRYSTSPAQWSNGSHQRNVILAHNVSNQPPQVAVMNESYQGRAIVNNNFGVYDNYVREVDPNVIEVAPVQDDADVKEEPLSPMSPGKSTWDKIGGFFRRKSSHGKRRRKKSSVSDNEDFKQLMRQQSNQDENDSVPPPLPPRSASATSEFGSNVFQPSRHVRPSSGSWTQSPTLPIDSPFNMQDQGLYQSSTRDFVRRHPSSSSSGYQQNRISWKETVKQRVEAKRNSLRDSSSSDSEDENQRYSSSLMDDTSSVASSSARYPRHSSRKSKPNSWRKSRDSIEDLALQMRMAQNEVLNRLSQIESVQQQISATPPPPPPRDPRRKLFLHRNDSGRPVSYSFEMCPSPNASQYDEPDDLGVPVVQGTHRLISPMHSNQYEPCKSIHEVGLPLVNVPRYASQPTLGIFPDQARKNSEEFLRPDGYPYDARRRNYSDSSRDVSPQQSSILKRRASGKTSTTSRDSVISTHQSSNVNTTSNSSIEKSGKSSPSSVSSKDSGCPDQNLPGGNYRLSRPLSALVEKSESQDQISTPPPPKEMSPPRSFHNDPGFSTKKRRSRFREAMNELEDVLASIQKDQDLLDRAERRDLPTVHQELIAQARERFQPGPSEENSRHDDSSNELFSDMDNFMNWNTSSSFENIPCSTPVRNQRQRTPANRRSGRYDKMKDDMVYRKCAANNKPPPSTINPIAKVDHSYLKDDPVFSPNATLNKSKTDKTLTESILQDDEPDTVEDDLKYRSHRDKNMGNIQDPQPKFGIPKDPVSGCSNMDYLHAIPEGKYRSTFHAMRNPDLVLDDLAFRNLRRDGNVSDPNHLGIVRDPNKDSIVSNTCWQHHQTERETREEEKGPFVFYPNKHNAIMKNLSGHIAQLIRKQAGIPGGGDEAKIITYKDLKNPEIFEAMKYTLNLMDAEEKKKKAEEEGEEDWEGKNLFQLLSSNVNELLEKKRRKAEESDKNSWPTSDDQEDNMETKEEEENPDDWPPTELVVQHCILEQDLSNFNQALAKHLDFYQPKYSKGEDVVKEAKKELTVAILSERVENVKELEQDLERSRSREDFPLENDPPLASMEPMHGGDCSTLNSSNMSSHASSEASPKDGKSGQDDGDNNNRGEGAFRQNQSTKAMSIDRQPLLILACYFLAVLHQFSGLDFLTALGIICAAISMISMFFI